MVSNSTATLRQPQITAALPTNQARGRYYRLHVVWSNRGNRAAVDVTIELIIYGVTPIEDSFVDVQPRQRDQLVTVTHHSQSYCRDRNR